MQPVLVIKYLGFISHFHAFIYWQNNADLYVTLQTAKVKIIPKASHV